MGPVCEVTLSPFTGELLDDIHLHLKAVTDKIVPTRKGRVWDVWLEGRPIHVYAEGDAILVLAAGCNRPEDWAIIERLASSLANALGGRTTKIVASA